MRPYPWEPHTYAEIYASLYGHCRTAVERVFECGIGTNFTDVASHMTQSGRPGASLRAWRDYFPRAEIYGADIDERVLFQEERIHTFRVDQTDKSSVCQLWGSIGIGQFDLMIDDGLHTFEASIVLFENSIAHLAPHGIYVIEDVKQQDLLRFRAHFANLDFFLTFFLAPKSKNAIVGDNAMLLIRRGA